MDYKDKEEQQGHGGKKKLTREDFKNDVADAVKKGLKKAPAKKARRGGKKGMYDSMSVAELRKLLTDKRKALLTKAGFPDGTLPRSKAAMIALCKKFKRKRW